jgi:peptidoglycan/xylan/chitin deacetylase (PgdA/CDA1 family)
LFPSHLQGKNLLIASGFSLFRATRLHRVAAPFTRGLGAILMFHRVRPVTGEAFAPNGLLEITPEFFDAVLTRLAVLGFDIVSLDEALLRMQQGGAGRPFAVLTFDDGTKDLRDVALPILERHNAPFVSYVATGFADRSARLWWIELEEAVRHLSHIVADIGGARVSLPAATAAEKTAAFGELYRRLLAGPEEELLAVIARLMQAAGLSSFELVDDICLDWAGVEEVAKHPLATIGVHTLTHPRLAKRSEDFARRELAESRRIIEAHIGKEARHLAYPVGDKTSAGEREFQLAQELGFASAVTTRPGMLFPQHQTQLMALPRLSINGNWQSLDAVEILLSGAPFALWNLAKRAA